MPADKRTEKSPLQNPRQLRSRTECCRLCKITLDFSKQTDEYIVKCSKCDDHFHCNCAGVSENFYVFYILQKQAQWLCFTCHSSKMDSAAATVDSIRKIEASASKMNADVQTLANEIIKLKNSDSSWKQEMEMRIETSIDKKIEERMAALRNLPIPRASLTNATHVAGRKNVVIAGVPRSANEDTVSVVKKLARQINFTMPNYMDNCFRVDKKGDTDEPPNNAIILLKFTTEIAMDSFMKCYFGYIRKKRLVPTDIGLEGEDRIYVNEQMNPEIVPLFKTALQLRREGKIAQVSSHFSHLSVKINSNGRDKWVRVHNERALHTLIGIGTTQDE